MDNQNRKPTADDKPLTQQQTTPTSGLNNANKQAKSSIDVSDIDAKALLAIQNFQTTQPKKKHGSKLILACLALLAALILVAYLLGALKPGNSNNSSNSSSNIGLPNQSNNYTGNGTTKQINQDVNSCSNPVNAVTTC